MAPGQEANSDFREIILIFFTKKLYVECAH